MKKITSWTRIPIIPLIMTLLCFNACTAIHFNTIAPPPPSTKLHVAILTITGEGGTHGYAITHEKWSYLMLKTVTEHLRDTGIYEVVPQEDVNYAVGTQTVGITEYWWLKNDCALLKQYGKALYAEYAMLITRDVPKSNDLLYNYNIKIINIETGMSYSVSDSLVNTTFSYERNAEIVTKEIWPRMYRKLFHEIKEDLLATAIRKGRLMPGEEDKKPAPRETKIALASPPVPQIAPAPPEVTVEPVPAPIAEALQKPIPPVSTAQEKEKAPFQPPLKPILEPVPATQTLPLPETPVPQAQPELAKEPLKAKAPEEAVPQSLPAAKLPDTIVQQPVPDTKKGMETPIVIAEVAPAPQPLLPAADKRKEFEKLEHEPQKATPATDKAKLVVYDFDTVERLSVVALILTDALREELFRLGRFSLVSRENVMQVMQELKLQHSGLVAEKEIVELGKWLAANQAVTGRLAMLGNSYILQAKRTDIKTMGTLGIGTVTCSSGREEELLSGIPLLARKLVESEK